MLNLVNELINFNLKAGIVVAKNIVVKPSPPELNALLKSLVDKRSIEIFPPDPLKESVRKLLKSGGFKPTGRNKPASEYLAQAAREGRFPFVNNLVDINNYISLLSGYPVTILDLEATSESVLIRHGKEGEKYIFNQSGQEIDLEGSIIVCKADQMLGVPLGCPVKDSMAGKIKDHTSSIIGVIYAPQELVSPDPESFTTLVKNFEELLVKYSEAQSTYHIVS